MPLPPGYVRDTTDDPLKGAIEMLYGARHQVSILAADLRADDRRAADRARARSVTEAAVRPFEEPRPAAANARVRLPARVRRPLTLLGRPAR